MRRVVVFMTIHGFSLFDLRKLYIDELYYFYKELIYSLEQQGKVKEGSYDKMDYDDGKDVDKKTVDSLRKQLFKIRFNK